MPNKKVGFTLIELIMVIVILTIIAGSSSAILIFFTQNTLFLPNQMNVQQAADVAMDIIIEGDDRAKGLRFAEITAFDDDSVLFTDADDRQVQFRRITTGGPTTRNRLERKIGNQAWEVIPYYATGDLRVTGQAIGLFSFIDDEGGSSPTDPDDINRIRINLLAQSGSGDINDWEGRTTLSSSVKLYKFNQRPFFDPVLAANEVFDITFGVNDLDGGEVSWSAELTGDRRGKLSQRRGIAAVPYNILIIYTPFKKFGSPPPATITIELDDGNGGITTDYVNIQVPQ